MKKIPPLRRHLIEKYYQTIIMGLRLRLIPSLLDKKNNHETL